MKTTKKINGGKIKLTKNNINDGYIREFINKIEGSDKVLSDEELIKERNKILPPSIQNKNIHFGNPLIKGSTAFTCLALLIDLAKAFVYLAESLS